MKTLTEEEINLVSGGNFFAAVGTGFAFYYGGASMIDATKTYNNFGSQVGEFTYNYTHPDQLGPMNFPKK